MLALMRPCDELAVPQAAFAAGRVDADDPQLAELALACAAVAEGKRLGPDERFLDARQQPAAAAGVALGLLEKAILLALARDADWWFASKEPFVVMLRAQAPAA